MFKKFLTDDPCVFIEASSWDEAEKVGDKYGLLIIGEMAAEVVVSDDFFSGVKWQ